MCFSPQASTILHNQSLQQWFQHVMFCAFSLPDLFVTTRDSNKLMHFLHFFSNLFSAGCVCFFRFFLVYFAELLVPSRESLFAFLLFEDICFFEYSKFLSEMYIIAVLGYSNSN